MRVRMVEDMVDYLVSFIPLKKLKNYIKKYITFIFNNTASSLGWDYFEMSKYMIDNPDKFYKDIEEFKKNLDNYSLEILETYLIQVKTLVQDKYRKIDLYTIPHTTKFYTDEQKILWASKNDLLEEIKKRYNKYSKLNNFFSLHVFYYECGLIYVPSYIKNKLENTIAIDCGGYTGDSAIMLLEEYKFKCIHVFEPEKNNLKILNNNIKQFNLDNFIKIHPYGVSDTKKKEHIYVNGGGTYIVDVAASNTNDLIETVIIDEYLEFNENDNISLIKLDIEGFEEQALKGAKNLIIKYKPILLISCYHDHIALGQMFRIKKFVEELNLGYKIIYRSLEPGTVMEYNLICYIE